MFTNLDGDSKLIDYQDDEDNIEVLDEEND